MTCAATCGGAAAPSLARHSRRAGGTGRCGGLGSHRPLDVQVLRDIPGHHVSHAAEIPDLDTTILCYCNAVNRGALSAATLRSMGYVNARYIDGGLTAYNAFESARGLEGSN